MKNHTKVYLAHFGYSVEDWIGCECGCGKRSVDIHHLNPRGMGGSKLKDIVENLMALSRECHSLAESRKDVNEVMKKIHRKRLDAFNNTGDPETMWK